MPVDAMMVSAGVLLMFLLFAGVLLWGDYQTRSLKADSTPPKRRSF